MTTQPQPDAWIARHGLEDWQARHRMTVHVSGTRYPCPHTGTMDCDVCRRSIEEMRGRFRAVQVDLFGGK